MRDYKQKHTEAYTGMFSQIGELYNVKVKYLLLVRLVMEISIFNPS